MKKGAPEEDAAEAQRGEFTSARFHISVTFRGITVDSVGPLDPFVLTYTPSALIVRYGGDQARQLPPQVRLVPWSNVACAEPAPAFLVRYMDAVRGQAMRR